MKRILSLVLVMLMALSLVPGAFAEFEPVEGTPYGILLFETIDDVDFAMVGHGHVLKRLLDLVDNVEVKEDRSQTVQGQTYGSLDDNFYFLDDGQYVHYVESVDNVYHSQSYQLFLFDKNDPYYYVKHMGGRDKWEVQPEMIEGILEGSICPFNPDIFDFEITSAEEVDGMYVFKLNLTPRTDLEDDAEITYSVSDCSLTIDPETSLIRGYAYDLTADFGEIIASAEVNYNVDKQPDYSLKY